MSNFKIIKQASSFFNENGLKYKSIKMYGKLLIVNVYDYQTAKMVQEILNGSYVQKTGIEGPTEEDDYDVTGLIEDALAKHLKEAESWNKDELEED